MLKALITLLANQKCTWKISFHGTYTQKHKITFCTALWHFDKMAWKEYETGVWGEDHECRRKLFYWFSLAVQFITQGLNLWNQLFWQSEKAAAFRTQEVGSHIFLIINFWSSSLFLMSKWSEPGQKKRKLDILNEQENYYF